MLEVGLIAQNHRTGHVLVAPRSRLGEALKRDEAGRTGVYFLVGDDPNQPTKARVYIGEGDVVADRIKMHANDESKDFWTRVCLVTSKDANLTKAHARYLESRLVELAKNGDRANVANGNEPSRKSLPESEIADMEFFIEQIRLMLPVIGFDFLRPRGTRSNVQSADSSSVEVSGIELVLTSKKHGYTARAVDVDGEITVLAGSRAAGGKDFGPNSYAPLREQLIKEKRLKPAEGGKYYEFADDVVFVSPSAAASVITGNNTNGRIAWRLKSTGQSLKEWQDAQVRGT